jgi:hypothetical protein
MDHKKVPYVGLKWRKTQRTFSASIVHKGKEIYCGSSPDPRKAVMLRDLAIIKHGISLSKLQILKPVEKCKS